MPQSIHGGSWGGGTTKKILPDRPKVTKEVSEQSVHPYLPQCWAGTTESPLTGFHLDLWQSTQPTLFHPFLSALRGMQISPTAYISRPMYSSSRYADSGEKGKALHSLWNEPEGVGVVRRDEKFWEEVRDPSQPPRPLTL